MEQQGLITKGLSTFQWFIFLLANSIALPIVIGGVFQLSIEEISTLMQRAFLVAGMATFIQGCWGHRYPIIEGPAGSWVSIFVILADVAINQGESLQQTLQIIEGGLIIAGLILFLLGWTGLVQRLVFLFTPLVTGVYLLLLALQLSPVFLRGMLGLQGEPLQANSVTTLISFSVFVIVILLSINGKGWLKNYAVLIGILSGWLLSALFGASSATLASSSSLIKLPEVFAWGFPQLNAGIMMTALLFTFTLISNTIGNIRATSQVLAEMGQTTEDESKRLNRGIGAGGLIHLLSSVFSTIGVVPLAVSAGFIRLTEQRQLRPFLIASLALVGISFFPAIVNVLANLPVSVASAALLASFVQMVGIALQTLLKEKLDQQRLTILGIALLIGIGLMFMPTSTFQGFPSAIHYVFSNGLIVGTIIAMILEQAWRK